MVENYPANALINFTLILDTIAGLPDHPVGSSAGVQKPYSRALLTAVTKGFVSNN